MPSATPASRGISPFSRGNRFGQAGPDFRAQADAALACIVQIERASALEAVDAIAALPDVDGLLMGPADLSADLGCELDLAGPAAPGRRPPGGRGGRPARQDGCAAHGSRGPGAGVPRARLHDALVHVRERGAGGGVGGRGRGASNFGWVGRRGVDRAACRLSGLSPRRPTNSTIEPATADPASLNAGVDVRPRCPPATREPPAPGRPTSAGAHSRAARRSALPQAPTAAARPDDRARARRA